MNGPNKGGYWPSWSERNFPPENIETSFLTHVYYAFLNPNARTSQFQIDGPTSSSLRRFTTALRRNNPRVKSMLSIGGGTADSRAFSLMASDQARRDRFIRSTIQVAREYNFNGLDFDWEYPETQGEMINFGILIEEWRVAINEEARSRGITPLLLSAATYYKPEVPFPARHAYPVASIRMNLDWINAMCYDYHGAWDNNEPTGTLAALSDPGGISTSNGLRSWITAGLGREKLVMGLPLYGRSWTLQNPNVNGLGAPAVGPGPGDREGCMSYAEVRAFNNQVNVRVVFDEPTQSYYSVAGSHWIAYDTVNSIERKIQYARENRIGGYFFWDISDDQGGQFSRPASVAWTGGGNPHWELIIEN